MKLWRLLILVMTFGPCPCYWTEIIASTLQPSATVDTVAKKCDCCHHKSDEPKKAPAKRPCHCNELVFVSESTSAFTNDFAGFCGIVVELPTLSPASAFAETTGLLSGSDIPRWYSPTVPLRI